MTISAVTWEGVDGSVWDLWGGAQKVALAPGMSGLHLPSFAQQTSQAARVPGQRYLGTVYGARDVILNVRVGGPGTTGNAWRVLDSAFWASLSPERAGTLTVTSDAGSRSLSCRLSEAQDPVPTNDPAVFGVASYQLTLEADQPFWTGPDVVVTLPYPNTPSNYYGGGSGTKGPPFYITGASAMTNASISNPGDQPAYTRWTFTGPGDIGFSINGHFTQVPSLLAGQSVSINTDPLAPNAVRDTTGGGSVNFWPSLGAHDFWVPVPAKSGDFPVPVTFTGGVFQVSQARVTLTPRYSRAW